MHVDWRTLYFTAHKTLPCGTVIEVTGPAGTVQVTVVDRGPYYPGRDLDLGPVPFQVVAGTTTCGAVPVTYRVL
jgi:rare lipoprotein A